MIIKNLGILLLSVIQMILISAVLLLIPTIVIGWVYHVVIMPSFDNVVYFSYLEIFLILYALKMLKFGVFQNSKSNNSIKEIE